MPLGVVTGVSREMGVLHGMEFVEGGAVLGVNVGHPIVTSGDFVAWLFSAVRGGDAALPKLVWDFLLIAAHVVYTINYCNCVLLTV